MADHRILLVEDNEDVGAAMVEILQGEGYAVTHASDGAEALAALRAGLKPCVIVLDLMMPVMSGVEFRQRQRADPSIAAIPVVVVSGVANMRHDIQAMGVARCFPKPVDWEELLGVMTELCPAA